MVLDPAMLDMTFWESVKTSSRLSELQAYLTQFPNGVFTLLAKIRIDELKALAAAPIKPIAAEQKPAAAIAKIEQKPLPQPSIAVAVAAATGHRSGDLAVEIRTMRPSPS